MPRPVAAAVVLVSAGTVLVLEILAMRLAAPYVGLTLETYSAAIGIALLGIAAGAWAGGELADRLSPRRTLGPLLIVGGGLVFVARPVVDGLGPHVQGTGPKGALLLVGAAIGPAIVALSMAHPAVVKLRLATLEQTGATVGGLSAVGTLGALGGTFLTGFVLLGEFSTRQITLGAGVVVIALGIVVMLVLGGRGLPATALFAAAGAALLLSSDAPCDAETRYFCARVEEPQPPVKALILDDITHALVDPRRPERVHSSYLVRVADVVAAAQPGGRPIRSLQIGGGGFALPRYLAAVRPGSYSRVLELDPGVVEISRRELGLRTGSDLEVRTGDARISILDEPSTAYDVVMGDAFASRSVPWHLTTREFLREVRRVMEPDGLYVMNVIDRGDIRFARAQLATLLEQFEHVAVLADQGPLGGNLIIVASPAPLPTDDLGRRAERNNYRLLDARALAAGSEILTDDYAPVDQLIG